MLQKPGPSLGSDLAWVTRTGSVFFLGVILVLADDQPTTPLSRGTGDPPLPAANWLPPLPPAPEESLSVQPATPRAPSPSPQAFLAGSTA